MNRSGARSFRATLEPDQTRLRWVVARVPFRVAEAWPVLRGLRVRGRIEDFAFRTSLFANPRGAGHVLLVNKKMLAAASAGLGSRVRITLEPDMEERTAEVPAVLARALKADRRLRKFYDGMSYSMRKEIGAWVSEPKGAAAREKRAEAMAERLLLTLEGEQETPPILEAAFRRQPLARMGWQRMTPIQRRSQLLAIFYYQTVEARERRAAKAVEEALRVARRATGGTV